MSADLQNPNLLASRAFVRRQYRLATRDRPIDCSCPCPVAHGCGRPPRVACEGTIPVGRRHCVLVLDGRLVAERCLPCAAAAGWIVGSKTDPSDGGVVLRQENTGAA